MIVGKYSSEGNDVVIAYHGGLRTIVEYKNYETEVKVKRVNLDRLSDDKAVGETIEKSDISTKLVFKKFWEYSENIQNVRIIFIDIDEFEIRDKHTRPDIPSKMIMSRRFKFDRHLLTVSTRISGGPLEVNGVFPKIDSIGRRWTEDVILDDRQVRELWYQYRLADSALPETFKDVNEEELVIATLELEELAATEELEKGDMFPVQDEQDLVTAAEIVELVAGLFEEDEQDMSIAAEIADPTE